MPTVKELISEKYIFLTKGERILADFILGNVTEAAFMTSYTMGAVSGTSQATAIRFARSLGYTGFSALTAALRRDVTLCFDSDEKMQLLMRIKDSGDPVSSVLAADTGSIRSALAQGQTPAITAVIGEIQRRRSIYIYGQGMCHFAALYLCAHLRQMGISVFCVSDPVEKGFYSIGRDDMFFFIGRPTFLRECIDNLRFAWDSGAFCAGISTDITEQLTPICHEVIRCTFGEHGAGGSLAPVISVLGAIICTLICENDVYARTFHSAEAREGC